MPNLIIRTIIEEGIAQKKKDDWEQTNPFVWKILNGWEMLLARAPDHNGQSLAPNIRVLEIQPLLKDLPGVRLLYTWTHDETTILDIDSF